MATSAYPAAHLRTAFMERQRGIRVEGRARTESQISHMNSTRGRKEEWVKPTLHQLPLPSKVSKRQKNV